MIYYFRKRLKGYSRKELEHIVASHNGYERDAVKAAILLLDENYGVSLPLPFKEESKNPYTPDVYTWQNYCKTFSYRELLSAVALSLMFFAAVKFLNYFRTVPFVGEAIPYIILMLIFLVCVLNHVFYKKEHGRQEWSEDFFFRPFFVFDVNYSS